jgi:hypothetical protein
MQIGKIKFDILVDDSNSKYCYDVYGDDIIDKNNISCKFIQRFKNSLLFCFAFKSFLEIETIGTNDDATKKIIRCSKCIKKYGK